LEESRYIQIFDVDFVAVKFSGQHSNSTIEQMKYISVPRKRSTFLNASVSRVNIQALSMQIKVQRRRMFITTRTKKKVDFGNGSDWVFPKAVGPCDVAYL